LRVVAGQYVGFIEIDNDIRHVSFTDFDSGFFVKEEDRIDPVEESPFAPKVLPMFPEWTLGLVAEEVGFEPTRSLHP
jgi:hypothetical protein